MAKTPPKTKAQSETPAATFTDQSEVLRQRILAYLETKSATLQNQLQKLEMAIADTGVDTQRMRAEQASKIRERVLDIQSDMATIQYISAK
jgi:uncharacterized coiled-coil protein SlyX